MAKTVGSTTIGSEFLYNANRSRVLHLEFDQANATTGEPTHYVRKRIYGLGATLESDFKNLGTGSTADWQNVTTWIYVPAPDGIVGTEEFAFDPTVVGGSSETASIYHYDHLGSIDRITTMGATTVRGTTQPNTVANAPGHYSEDAWGARRNPDTWTGKPSATDIGGSKSLSPRGFTGHEMLDDLGLVHMNGRIYDPLIGRMLSADAVVQFPGDLQSYNRYSYVQNNPLRFVDPSGFLLENVQQVGINSTEEIIDAARAAPGAGKLIIVGAVVTGSATAVIVAINGGIHAYEAHQQVKRTDNELRETQERMRNRGVVPTPAEKKPLVATPAEVKIDKGAIQSNGQGDTVKTNQSPAQETKQDASKQNPENDAKKDDSGGKDSKEAASTKAKFGSGAKLLDHFQRHGGDFGAKDAADYQDKAAAFLTGKPADGVQESTRENGDVVRFNPKTQEFGVISSDGTIRTYYKPDPEVHGRTTNQDYFNDQTKKK
jgi:RHS repeat-associated protein